MLTREAVPSYIGLFLLCVVAATESAVAHLSLGLGRYGHWVPMFSTLAIAGAIWISFHRGASADRGIRNVYQDIKSGRQQPSTTLQKINLILGILLLCLVWRHLFLG